MSADHDHAEHGHSIWFYTGVITVLALITLVELAPLFEFFNLPVAVLLVLSVVKFTIVVLLFMHLWDDSRVFKQLFFMPLLGAVAMVFVLMMLFSSITPSPRTDSIPVQERYWTDYSGQCRSWVRSHISNRWYCTSPPIDPVRLALYNQAAATAAAAPAVDVAAMSPDEAKQTLVQAGEKLYTANCSACHQATGLGVPPAFPPLAGSDFAGLHDPGQHVQIITKGLSGAITVNGVAYNGAMPAVGAAFSDFDVAAIATYERSSWGNDLGVILPTDVAKLRAK